MAPSKFFSTFFTSTPRVLPNKVLTQTTIYSYKITICVLSFPSTSNTHPLLSHCQSRRSLYKAPFASTVVSKGSIMTSTFLSSSYRNWRKKIIVRNQKMLCSWKAANLIPIPMHPQLPLHPQLGIPYASPTTSHTFVLPLHSSILQMQQQAHMAFF